MSANPPQAEKIRIVEVVPHDPRWSEAFEQVAATIASALGPLIVAIHHAGSTAIPTTHAKPILDLLVEVHALDEVDAYNEALRRHGYEPRGEYGIAGRRFFVMDRGERRLQNVHTFQTGHPEIARMLLFRDYLRTHLDDAADYGALKAKLAQDYPHDIEGYMAGKRALVQALIEKARQWQANQARD